MRRQTLREVDVVGLQERFDEFGVELERRFGWRIDERLRLSRKSGRSPRLRTRSDAGSPRTTPADMEFYEFAVELYEGRNGVRR